jgi:type I restriction enzyme S subunit
MLQPEPISRLDLQVRYLKAANVQWETINLDSLPVMWASPNEIDIGHLTKGDLVVCEGGEVGRAAILAVEPEETTILQNALHRVRSNTDTPKYLMYWLEACASRGWLEVECNKATIQHFTRDKFGALMVSLPTRDEQNQIVSFLDRETAKIDALIEKKERLIELLQEKRTALITQAVTKSLDPNVPVKDSGVEWLGRIPSHWHVEKNKRLFRESDIRSELGDEELLTVSHISGVTRHSEKNVTMIEPESYEDYRICRAGELAINTMWAWMGALGIAKEKGIVSPSYGVYSITAQSLQSRYYDYLSRIPLHVAELTRYSKGIWKSRLRLYPKEFFEIYTPIPPINEQEYIVDYLDQSLSKTGTIIMAIKRAIENLRDFRVSLISAAVTGKIDVRG